MATYLAAAPITSRRRGPMSCYSAVPLPLLADGSSLAEAPSTARHRGCMGTARSTANTARQREIQGRQRPIRRLGEPLDVWRLYVLLSGLDPHHQASQRRPRISRYHPPPPPLLLHMSP